VNSLTRVYIILLTNTSMFLLYDVPNMKYKNKMSGANMFIILFKLYVSSYYG